MRHPVEIENIDELRRREGIDDVELREEIRRLQVGDHVKLTFLAGKNSFVRETLVVRITSIRGWTLRGKLADRPACSSLAQLRVGSLVTFTADQIHSVANPRPKLGGMTTR